MTAFLSPFAGDRQDAVPALGPKDFDVRAGGLGYPRPVEGERRELRVLGHFNVRTARVAGQNRHPRRVEPVRNVLGRLPRTVGALATVAGIAAWLSDTIAA